MDQASALGRAIIQLLQEEAALEARDTALDHEIKELELKIDYFAYKGILTEEEIEEDTRLGLEMDEKMAERLRLTEQMRDLWKRMAELQDEKKEVVEAAKEHS